MVTYLFEGFLVVSVFKWCNLVSVRTTCTKQTHALFYISVQNIIVFLSVSVQMTKYHYKQRMLNAKTYYIYNVGGNNLKPSTKAVTQRQQMRGLSFRQRATTIFCLHISG